MKKDQYSAFWDETIPPADSEALPTLTFQESFTSYFNGEEVTVTHVAGHTDGDLIVFFREANVIHLGDLVFSGIFPNSDLNDGGSIDIQILAVQHVLNLIDEETTIIVGHGPPMNRKDLEACHAMMIDIRDRIERLIQEDWTLDQIIASHPTSKYEEGWGYGSLTRDRYIELIYRHVLSRKKD
jgi:glyoxylase-like metal-dependent hydrolase (beta-lactamase superfamily II)